MVKRFCFWFYHLTTKWVGVNENGVERAYKAISEPINKHLNNPGYESNKVGIVR